ncbi:hypothetical protein JJB09_22180 [Rhizobium sp. KVB221]|uniref:Uncharacterized protein n=1 Tax=Rhizobium setariae TaxID=2801340 RepID=A0A936YTN2_9HYPH|nr:hypothetical protein [Rhizobium setariae]MBL0374726.1 hypothetical protein [Rhizobium setariae]
MRMYMIAIVVAAIGLWASGQAQAKDFCGQRSATVFSVKKWDASSRDGNIHYTVTLASGEQKAVTRVGGTIEFIGKAMKPITHSRIELSEPIEAKGEVDIVFSEPETEVNKRLLANAKNDIHVLACVDSVEYADGSGTIIN